MINNFYIGVAAKYFEMSQIATDNQWKKYHETQMYLFLLIHEQVKENKSGRI